jgi:hypothetical protein
MLSESTRALPRITLSMCSCISAVVRTPVATAPDDRCPIYAPLAIYPSALIPIFDAELLSCGFNLREGDFLALVGLCPAYATLSIPCSGALRAAGQSPQPSTGAQTSPSRIARGLSERACHDPGIQHGQLTRRGVGASRTRQWAVGRRSWRAATWPGNLLNLPPGHSKRALNRDLAGHMYFKCKSRFGLIAAARKRHGGVNRSRSFRAPSTLDARSPRRRQSWRVCMLPT